MTRSPRFLGSPLAPMPRSQTPVGPSRLAMRTSETTGSRCCRRLSPAARGRCRCLNPLLGRCLAASWRVGFVPALNDGEDPNECVFRGSIARPRHSLSTLRSPASRRRHARLACSRWPTLAARDWLPAGLRVRFQTLHGFPLTQALPGATFITSRRDRVWRDLASPRAILGPSAVRVAARERCAFSALPRRCAASVRAPNGSLSQAAPHKSVLRECLPGGTTSRES